MSKRNRGKTLRKLAAQGRGDCPLCSRGGIKLLYDHKTKEDKVIKVCKYCRNK